MSVHAQSPSSRPAIRRGPALLALFIGGAISLLSETIINVALAPFMESFGVSATSVQWLTTGYMLIIGILVPVTAFLLEWLSTKQVFMGALGIYTVGTIVAGAAPSFPVLLVGRIIQAIGTGPMVPLLVNTALLITPREQHGRAMGLCQLVLLAMPAIAPALAGIMLQYASWRWLFYSMLPFALLSALLALRFLEIPRDLTHPRLDLPSIVLSTLGFGSLIYGVSAAGSDGVLRAMPFLVVGIVILGLFVWRELSVPEPMLDLSSFRYPQFRLGMLLIVVMMMGFFADMLLLPMYLQAALLVSPLVTGIAMLPGGLLNGAGSLISGRLYDRSGPSVIVPAGLGLMAAGLFAMSLVLGSTNSALEAVLLYAAMMLGLPYAMTPVQTNSLSGLPAAYYAHGTAIMNTFQMIAASLGSSLFIGVMSSRQAAASASGAAPGVALIAGLKLAFLCAATLMAAAWIASLFIRGSGTVPLARASTEAGAAGGAKG